MRVAPLLLAVGSLLGPLGFARAESVPPGAPAAADVASPALLSPSTPIATVNGIAITAREFVEAQQRLRARFGADASALRAAALAECIDWQIRLQFARQHAVIADPTDAAVRSAFGAENARRTATKALGQPVYGPRQFTWPQFRVYWLDLIERETRARLDRAAGPESEAELRAFYAAHPALFTAPKRVQPEPFSELEDHVRDEYRKARYARLLAEARAAATVATVPDLLARLSPTTVLP